MLQQAPGLEIARGHGLAARAPKLRGATATDKPGQALALAGALGSRGKNGADLKGPEAGAARLQVAPCGKQQLLHQAIAQMAVVGQEGIGEGHPRGNRWGRRRGFRPGGTELAGGRSQGEVAGFLQAGGGQGPAQAPLHMLVGTEAPRFERIGQVAGKPVVAHQAGHLLN